MATPNDRLKSIRSKRYSTAREAAAAMGATESTYIQHENGTRGTGSIPRAAAERYATFYKVSLDWLLTGKGDEPELAPTIDGPTLEAMLAEELFEVPPGTPLADYPRLVAPGLRRQLERLLAGDVLPVGSATSISRGKGVQSPAPTISDDPAEPRMT